MLPRRDLGRESRPTHEASALDGLASLTRLGAHLQNFPTYNYEQYEHIVQFSEIYTSLEQGR